jgi:hypothetical protein
MLSAVARLERYLLMERAQFDLERAKSEGKTLPPRSAKNKGGYA